MIASLTFVTPVGGLLALAVLLPAAAFAVSTAQGSRGRALLGLEPPESKRHTTLYALAAVPVLLGLAAAGPALRRHVGQRVRTDAEAIFVFDTSRSMAASRRLGAPTRFVQARAAAIQLRNNAIPDVPSGIASLTTQLLPHLFPTPNQATFNSTVEAALGIEKPPPPVFQFGVTGTSFWPLSGLRDQGFFDETTKHRFAILLTDGESGPFDTNALAKVLQQTSTPSPFPGRPAAREEAPVSLFIVRVGDVNDRIYNSDGSIEATYRPDPRAGDIVRTLAAAAQGHAFAASQLSAAAKALRTALGSGRGSLQGVNTKTTALAPYVVLVAFAPLALIIRRRNLTQI